MNSEDGAGKGGGGTIGIVHELLINDGSGVFTVDTADSLLDSKGYGAVFAADMDGDGGACTCIVW